MSCRGRQVRSGVRAAWAGGRGTAGVSLLLLGQLLGCQVSGPLQVTVHDRLASGSTHLALVPLFPPRALRGRASQERLGGAAARLTGQLREALAACGGLYLTPQEAVERAVAPERLAAASDPWEVVKTMGAQLGLDGVLVGSLLSYSEREGGSLGARKPARVAFVLRLKRIPDGKEVWRAEFEEAQKPLLEDLASIGRFVARGGRYVTADELAAGAAQAVAESFCRYILTGP